VVVCAAVTVHWVVGKEEEEDEDEVEGGDRRCGVASEVCE
jgi:hypothetical protein